MLTEQNMKKSEISRLSSHSRFLEKLALKYAEREIIKHVQRLLFPDVLKAMQRISSSKPPRQVASEL